MELSPPFFDPTNRRGIAQLRERLLRSDKTASYIKSLAAEPPGIVLSGGGAKGAYEAGVILALYDLGIRNFAVAAGTSVGSLNAVLLSNLCVANDEPALARTRVLQVWCNITRAQIMKLSIWSFIIKALTSLVYIQRYVIDRQRVYIRDIDEHNVNSWTDDLKGLLFEAVFFVPAFFIERIMFAAPIIFIAWDLDHILFRLLVVAIALPLCTWLMRKVFRSVAFASSAPLAVLMSGEVAVAANKLAFPVNCTVARKTRAKDPVLYPRTYTPIYIGLKGRSADEIRDVLLTSAALPEIFKLPKQVVGPLVDGGLADNTPILALYQEKPRRIIIVYLNHRFEKIKEELWIREARRVRHLLSTRKDLPFSEVMGWLNIAELVPIIPSRNIGGTVLGTLNFDTKKARKLVLLGYLDTLRQVRRMSWGARFVSPYASTGLPLIF